VKITLEVIQLSSAERNIFLSSLPVINKKMDFFVIRFYYYFLRTKAGLLFQHTNIEKQYQMFNSSLNVILTHIADPTLLEDHLQELIKSHVEYGVISEHIDYFIDSFMKALTELFDDESDKAILEVWNKVITDIMIYFKNDLS
jgi:hemoglobin-like flavoprotein